MQRLVGFSIISFWFVMVGLLIQRTQQLTTMPTASPPAPVLDQAQTEWMGIYQHEHKVGYLKRQILPTAAGYEWRERWRMQLNVLNTTQVVQTDIHAQTDTQYALSDFSFRLLSSGSVFQVSGQVQPDQISSPGSTGWELRGQLTTGGETTPFSFPLSEPVYLSSITQMALRQLPLEPGLKRQFKIFNPLSLQPDSVQVTVIGPETLSINGRPTTLTKVAERVSGTTVHAWLDDEGRVVKEEATLGLMLLREGPEVALGHGWQDGTPLDLAVSAAIPVQQSLADPRLVTSLRLAVSGIQDPSVFHFPPRQTFDNTSIVISIAADSDLTSYHLPQTDPALAVMLQPSPLLQSDHPRIQHQAQAIIGSESDAVRATTLLLDWTHSQIEQVPTTGIPTALETLATKRGDCNEHAVLFTALARAVGLPSRVAAGVVYMDSAFYYHAWSEVWLGRWVAVDPVLDQFPADASHVKFIQGGPERHLALLKLIGRVELDIVDFSAPADTDTGPDRNTPAPAAGSV